jgi:5'-3' exonuclease
MNEPWLLLDVSYLCYRAAYTTGNLEHEGAATGVIFGVLRDIIAFQEYHQSSKIVFCFDSKHSKRRMIYPEYKANRRNKGREDPKVWDMLNDLHDQINRLRKELLPEIGFRNIFVQRGREGDDLIAITSQLLAKVDEDSVIISADKDLYQCLGPRVTMWKPQPKKFYTAQHLMDEFGVRPDQWAAVKSIAGDSGDNVPGVPRVAEKTAAKFINHQLSDTHHAIENIRAFADQTRINMQLVQLPIQGTKAQKIRKDKISRSGWESVTKELGMGRLARSLPRRSLHG